MKLHNPQQVLSFISVQVPVKINLKLCEQLLQTRPRTQGCEKKRSDLTLGYALILFLKSGLFTQQQKYCSPLKEIRDALSSNKIRINPQLREPSFVETLGYEAATVYLISPENKSQSTNSPKNLKNNI